MSPSQVAGNVPMNMCAQTSQVTSLLRTSGPSGPREIPAGTDSGSLSLFLENPVVFAKKLIRLSAL